MLFQNSIYVAEIYHCLSEIIAIGLSCEHHFVKTISSMEVYIADLQALRYKIYWIKVFAIPSPVTVMAWITLHQQELANQHWDEGMDK